MQLPRIIRNFNAFIDGRTSLGRATEAKLPQPKIATAAHRGAGMDAAVGIDTGMEAMPCDVTMNEFATDALKLLGTLTRIVLRPAGVDPNGGAADIIIASMTGLVTETAPGDLKSGQEAMLKVAMDVRAYKLEVNGVLIHDIDIAAGKRTINGVDQLRGLRAAMGL